MGTNRKKGVAPPRYDAAFKAGAVKLVTEQDRSSTEVAKELGICIDTLRSWLKASSRVSTGQADRQKREARRLRKLEAEVRTLRKQVAEKDEGIDILKKSGSWTGQPVSHAQTGLRLLPQAGTSADAAKWDLFGTDTGLQGHHQRPAQPPIAPNLLQRRFSFEQPNQT